MINYIKKSDDNTKKVLFETGGKIENFGKKVKKVKEEIKNYIKVENKENKNKCLEINEGKIDL